MKSEAHILLEIHLKELGLKFVPEFRFHNQRKWRFDYLLVDDAGCRFAVEIEGGIHSRGRHTRGVGFEKDLEKYREAAVRGWYVLRFSTAEVLNGTAKAFIEEHCL
jgi:very-short-patch-repair endonuclease